MKLWLDDARTPPDSTWTWVKTVSYAIQQMETGEVSEASLDHDLGLDGDGRELPEGRTLVYWMAENDYLPYDAWNSKFFGHEFVQKKRAGEP